MTSHRCLTLSAISAAVLVTAASMAAAQSVPDRMKAVPDREGAYFTAGAGLLSVTDNEGVIMGVPVELKTDSGWAAFGGIGYRMNYIRSELELAYGETSYDSVDAMGISFPIEGDVEIFQGSIGVYMDIPTGMVVTPYLGGGGGFSNVDVASFTIDGTRFEGASDTYWQAFVEGGLSLALTDQLEVVPSYRFNWVFNGGGGFDDDRVHVIKAGLRLTL